MVLREMIQTFAVVGETTTFVSPEGLDFFSNGEWYAVSYSENDLVIHMLVMWSTILI